MNAEDLRAYNWSLEGKERFQMYRCPEPPPHWSRTAEEWRSSSTYQTYQQHFAQKLEDEFAAAIQALSIHISTDAQNAFDDVIMTACRDNPGWFWDIRKAAAVYALTGTFSQNALNRMVYLVQEGLILHPCRSSSHPSRPSKPSSITANTQQECSVTKKSGTHKPAAICCQPASSCASFR